MASPRTQNPVQYWQLRKRLTVEQAAQRIGNSSDRYRSVVVRGTERSLQYAVKTGRILRNPCEGTTPPVANDFEPTLPTIPQLQAYLEDARATGTPAEHALYVTAAGTGARLGELLALPKTPLMAARSILSEPSFVPAKTLSTGNPRLNEGSGLCFSRRSRNGNSIGALVEARTAAQTRREVSGQRVTVRRRPGPSNQP